MFFVACFSSFIFCIHYAHSTEISVSASTIDDSLGLEIELPTLMCHAKHTEYKEVTWYKDYTTVKKGSADLESHLLSLASLLNSSTSSVAFDNPLKLQGYYWCETEHTVTSTIHDYLFRIKEIHTFVGNFVATKDSLGDAENLNVEDKISWKMNIYEEEMETELFGLLPTPSVHVTSLKVLKNGGLGIRFFLYVRQVFHPRKAIKNDLLVDQHHLTYIQEYLKNETSSVHAIVYDMARNWTDLLGIRIEDIDLRSTLGCYEEIYLMPSNTSEEVIWPYARIGEVVITENACSSRNGLAVTRMCTGSFYLGAKWGNPSGKCEKSAEGITLQLRQLHEDFGNEKRAHFIRKFVDVMSNPSDLRMTDLHIAIEILKELSLLSKLNQQEVSGILSVIDKIVETNKTEMIAAKNIIRLTSRILQIFDNLLKQASEEDKEIQISKSHLMIDTKHTQTTKDDDHVLGLAVISPNMQSTLLNGSIEFVTTKSNLPKHDALAYFALPMELVLERELDLKFPCQVNMVFFKEWYLFQNPKSTLVKRNYKVLPTPVMYVSISGGPAFNLTDPVQLYFKDMLDVEVEDPVCVYYDPKEDEGAGAWSTEGCEYKGFKNGYHHCQCHHLSIFAVILSQSPETGHGSEKLRLGTSVYVGCGVSMLALAVTVLLYILSKNWRQTVDHSVLFCLSLTFLICIIIIFISEMYFARKTGCIVLAMLLHHGILSIFGWLSVQAIIYRLRFAKKTDMGEIPHFMLKASIVVWGVPVLIVIIMWVSREYPCGNDNCWLTVTEVSKEALIPIVLLILIALCINVCATYSLTCRYRKDFLIGDSSYNDVALKFRVAFTIFFFFVLSWLFGFFALHKTSKTLRILFSICITLTAYYVSLFFIFQEVSFWELCHRCKREEEETDDTPAVQYKKTSYNAMEEADNTAGK